MKLIIVGLGRMGTELALQLTKQGHSIVAIDSNPEVFSKLGKEFSGKAVAGIGFDKEVLEQAEIERADGLVACTSTDEANAVIARIAKNHYKVPRVIARLYDIRKADIYRRLGIRTISTTSWGVSRTMQILTYDLFDSVYAFGSGHTNLVRIEAPPMLVGHEVRELMAPGEIHVTSITRKNKTFLPTFGTKIEAGDLIYITVINSARESLRRMLGME